MTLEIGGWYMIRNGNAGCMINVGYSAGYSCAMSAVYTLHSTTAAYIAFTKSRERRF
jgi:hypothetical protein